jgi:hypothetical protein
MDNKFEFFKEVFEKSQNENRGLTVYIKWQTIVGVVTKIVGTDVIEMRSQMFGKAVVLIASIDAASVS